MSSNQKALSVQISMTKLIQNDVFEWLRFVYNVSPAIFISTFKDKAGFIVEGEQDLKYLEDLSLSGNDLSGKMINSQGKSIKFNILEILKAIPMTQADIENSPVYINQ